jgi:uncharacterized protein (TIGR03435 family)
MAYYGTSLVATILWLMTIGVAESQSVTAAEQPDAEFEAVSIKPVADPSTLPRMLDRPDGGFILRGGWFLQLFARAFPDVRVEDIVGLPEWVSRDVYDIEATSSGTRRKSESERQAMIRALLTERLGLVFHWEHRDIDVFALVIDRKDAKLGSQLRPIDVDCAALAAMSPPLTGATQKPFDPNAPSPQCSFRNLYNRFDGDSTMADFARVLRRFTSYDVVDNTGLRGYFRLTLAFDPVVDRQPDKSGGDQPGLSTALREQLGLRLERIRANRPVLVIDGISRPTVN